MKQQLIECEIDRNIYDATNIDLEYIKDRVNEAFKNIENKNSLKSITMEEKENMIKLTQSWGMYSVRKYYTEYYKSDKKYFKELVENKFDIGRIEYEINEMISAWRNNS